MYIISKIAIALISPLGTALLLGITALLFGCLGRKRRALLSGGIALAWLWVWSLPAASDWLRSSLEGQFPAVAIEALPQAEAIVVLGGGVLPPAIGHDVPNLEAGADRVWHGARLFHAAKAPLVLLSGGADLAVSAKTEAQSMQEVMLALGVDESAILLEMQSRNTAQNARFSAEILRERGVDEILLVTSALHMQRALARFKQEGLQVIPSATDHEVIQRHGWQDVLPDTQALNGSARAMKEWVGYWVGR